jgi:hypothetical protein
MGIPKYPECRGSEYAAEWHREYDSMTGSVSWFELMGNSVHAQKILATLDENVKRFMGA